MTATIDYIMSNYSDAHYTGAAIKRLAIDVLTHAIGRHVSHIKGVVGGINLEYTDDAGMHREMQCEVYRMRITRVHRAIEVGLTNIPMAADDVTRYAVGVFEHPVGEYGIPCSPYDPRVQEWERDVVRPRAAAMVRAVWGDWASAARAAGCEFCTPDIATEWLGQSIVNAARWAAWEVYNG